ncbi:hypothetical protein ES703_73516 [subsurface metagenome]
MINQPSSKNKKHLVNIIRRIARVWSLLSIVFVLVIVIGHIFSPEDVLPTIGEWVGILFFPFGVILGLTLSWKWEGLGAMITIGSLIGIYITILIIRGCLPKGPFFVLFATPGFFFLISWLLSRINGKTQKE